MASLNKAQEHSEQYARCRVELREVENEPPISCVARNAVGSIGKGPSRTDSLPARGPPGTVESVRSLCRHYGCVVLWSCCFIYGNMQGPSTLQTADEPPFLLGRGIPARPGCDAMRRSACGDALAGPPAAASHDGAAPTVCHTPIPEPPGTAPHDTRKPLSPLDSPYYGKYMHSCSKAQPALWEAAAQLGLGSAPPAGKLTAVCPTSSAVSSCIRKSRTRSAVTPAEHHVPKLQVCLPMFTACYSPKLPLQMWP